MGMQTFAKARELEIDSMGLEGIQAFLRETVSSKNDAAPMTCGFFRMEAGKPLDYTYGYDEFKLVLEGEITVAEKGGDTVRLTPGDVVFFEKGTSVTFSSPSSGAVFFVGQRRAGEL